jgi:hypothetical protein
MIILVIQFILITYLGILINLSGYGNQGSLIGFYPFVVLISILIFIFSIIGFFVSKNREKKCEILKEKIPLRIRILMVLSKIILYGGVGIMIFFFIGNLLK